MTSALIAYKLLDFHHQQVDKGRRETFEAAQIDRREKSEAAQAQREYFNRFQYRCLEMGYELLNHNPDKFAVWQKTTSCGRLISGSESPRAV